MDMALSNDGFDKRHGGPYDRGSADYYYRRPFSPHYYRGYTWQSEKVDYADMTEGEVMAYRAGWDDAEKHGDQKEW
jgi:hypothetical protein